MARVTFNASVLKKFGIDSKAKMERVARESVAEAGARVIERTPVDTGFARSQWFPTVNGQPSFGQGGYVVAAVAFSGFKLGERLGMANGTEYIDKLEYGSSAQAPQGMVRATVAEWPAIVHQVALRVAGS